MLFLQRSCASSALLAAQLRRAFSIANFSAKPLKYELAIKEEPGKMPVLTRKPDEILIKQWWSQTGEFHYY